ncbi:multiple epidermal growth factor-like domains protein 10 [Argopecten irradians]|uniref:multiple epidermal growth factor-like domains protein 10 n=1 Tax=Argopecten irradians TaxID=31199 RepID=UPI00371B8267
MEGWTGYSCDRECTSGTFGLGCARICHCNIPGCDHVTGLCFNQSNGCKDGWKGPSCDTECSLGTFGQSCAARCHCRTPGCDHETGVCTHSLSVCDDGWTGSACNQECPFGTFGRLCSYECHCNNMGCDKVTGHCLNQQDACAEGWTGVSCDKECDLGFFGVSCLNVCHCLVPGCNPVSGVCNTSECERGWSGYACNISVQGEMEKDVSNGIIHEYGIISAICVGLLLVISVAVNVWMCVKRKRTRMSDNADNEPCYENVQHRQLSSPTTSQTCDATATPPGYEELQFRNATRKAYENVTYENSYDSVELRAGGNSTARL